MTTLGILLAAGLVLSACGASSTTTTTTTSTTTTTTTTTTAVPTKTTVPPAAAENLFISPGTVDELMSTFATYHHIALRVLSGAAPGSIYYGYVPATRTYWARAQFLPSAGAPLAVDVELQDGGGDAILDRAPGHPWRVIVSVGVPFCGGLLHEPVPRSILAVWELCQARGSTMPTTPQRCSTSQLSVKVGAFQSALGTDRFPLVFTNTGTSSCLLQGFPGVSFEAPSGAQIAAAAERQGTTDGPTITVSPGAAATADAIVIEGAAVACRHPRTARGFRVYPPNQYTSLLVRGRNVICQNAPASTLQIYPFGINAPI